ncbi:MAG: response regulator transcription factor [Chitinophagaceae bacterium]
MEKHSSKTRIAIADDHTLFRKGLIKLLDEDRYELLFDVENGKMLIDKISANESNPPDIVIMDIEMPGMNGYEAVSWIRDNHPPIKILVVSMVDREEAIVRMLKLGVKGYLSKDMEPEDLHAALQSIIKKDYYYTDFVTNKLVHSIQNDDSFFEDKTGVLMNHELWETLSARQKEFVRYACTEMIYEEIADKMYVSPKTIDGYRDAVFEKFSVKSRVGLVLYAIRNKLVSI